MSIQDFKLIFKENRKLLFSIFIGLIIIFYLFLFFYNGFKSEDASKEGLKKGDEISLENEKLTYINSYYDPDQKIFLIHLGINSVASLFDETNIKAELISQKDTSKIIKGKIKKPTQQILELKFDNVQKNYTLARVTLNHLSTMTDTQSSESFYLKHDSKLKKDFTNHDYKLISLNFKNDFLSSEIQSLNKEIIKFKKMIDHNKKVIEELSKDNSLLTDDEKMKVSSKIESLKSENEEHNKEIQERNELIQQREKQKEELNKQM